MTGLILRTLLSHWRSRPFQIVTLLLGLTVATALWSGVQAINAEARASYAQAAATLGTDRFDSLRPRGAERFDQRAYVALRRAGWLVSPIVEGDLRLDGARFRVLGIDPVTAPADLPARPDLQGDALTGFLGQAGLILTDAQTAGRLPADAGLPPVRVMDGIAPRTLVMDIGTAQRLLNMSGELSRLIVLPEAQDGIPPLAVAGIEWNRIAPRGADGGIAALTDSFHLNLTAFGFLAFAVGLFIVYSSIGLAFEQRKPMLRTLRALGVPLRLLMLVMVAELTALALLAGIAGIALGYLIAASLLPDVAATLQGLYGAQVSGTLSLRPAWWLTGLAIAMGGAGLAAADTLWRTARMPLLSAALPEAWHGAQQRAQRVQGIAALGCFAVAAVLSQTASSLTAGFVLMGALLVGAALSLPVVLSVILGLGARRARGPLAQWGWADARQQMSRLSLALMALLLALSANIGVGTMVMSFRDTFTGWLDQRLVAEVYVTASDTAQGQEIQRWAQGRVDAVLPIWSTEIRLGDAPASIYGVAQHATYSDHWPLIEELPDAWQSLASGQAAMINEQMAGRRDLSPGDRIIVPLPDGGEWPMIVAAIYSDYGNPTDQIMVDVDLLSDRFPDIERLRFALRTDQTAEIIAEARDRFALPPDQITDQAAIKALSLAIFERTFTVTGALNVLTLAVAALALLTAMLTLQLMRLPSLAPLWAMGLTRAALARAELLKVMALALLTAILAIPVGLGVAWVLTNVINVTAFGWRLPMNVYPADWLRLIGLSLLTAAIAAGLPVLRLARTAPRTLLGVFASER